MMARSSCRASARSRVTLDAQMEVPMLHAVMSVAAILAPIFLDLFWWLRR